MRIPMPEKLRIKNSIIFATLLFIGQQFTHTDLTFSLLCAAFIMIWTLGFNAGGGMFFMSGAYIFFNGTITCIIGLVYKVFLGEPGHTNLIQPNTTMLLYCAGMAGMWFAATMSQRLIPKTALLATMSTGDSMKRAAVGCFLLGAILQVVFSGGIDINGSFASAIAQLNHFMQMSMILAVTYEVNASEGKSSTNWVVWASGVWLFAIGAINFSKEGMFMGPVSYLIPAAALGYNFSKKQIITFLVGLFIMLHYLVPFSQYGRTFRGEGGVGNYEAAVAMLRHPEGTRKLYLETEEAADDKGDPHYYNSAQGLFDREQMLAYDDAIINYTDQGNVYGLGPVYAGFANIVPRFIWKDKPVIGSGNNYGRELGVIASDDETTGISFSPTGDAYHEAKWVGVLVAEPIVLFMLFFICDTLAGDTRRAPWNLLLIALCSHIAPEGLLQGPIYVMSYCTFALYIISMLAKHVLPLFSKLLTGGDRTRVEQTFDFRPAAAPPRFSSTLPLPPAKDAPAS